ncbi:MAG: galactokinase [Kosmotoga sp.]|nr:galactokinase [Kosmotoga sp.]
MGNFEYYVAPGRINIIGEHTDYNDGYVLPAAINKYIQVGVRKAPDNKITVRSAQKGTSAFSTDSIEKANDWSDYIRGVFWILKKEKNIDFPGLELEITSNIPEGAGLSSSAALEVAVITALNGLLNLGLTDKERIILCQKAENDFVGVQCGIMDQFASVMGKENKAIFLDTYTMDYEYIPLELKDYSLLVIDSGVRHTLSSGDYNKRREEAKKALAELGKTSYRDVKLADVLMARSKISEISYRRAMHIVSENMRVLESVDILKHSNFENLGRLLIQSHESLAFEYEVSCEELDFMVEKLRNLTGVSGCRMIGAGFGGSVLAICEKTAVDSIISELSEVYKKAYNHEPKFYDVLPSDGARKVEKPIL